MAYTFTFPDVGEGITEGEIVRWLVAVGDRVALDQPLVEMQTDKAVVEIPSPRAGVILSREGQEGDVIPVGATLVVIGDEEEARDQSVGTEEPRAAEAPERNAPAPEPVDGMPPGEGWNPLAIPEATPRRVQAAPATRRLAREMGLDLTQIVGSGPRGRILPKDVRAAAERKTAPAAPTAVEADRHPVRLQGLRRVIAEHMERSVREIPQVTVVDRLVARRLVAVREALKASAEPAGVRITYLPFVAKALAMAVADYPLFNGRWEDGTFYQYRPVHVGIATDTSDGLMVPVVRHVETKSLREIAREMGELSEGARARRLAPGDLTGSTITITGGGPLAGLFATPIINYPEVAIVGVYRIQEEVVVEEGEMRPAPVLYLSLTFDHRIADGADASRFLSRLKELLADPSLWLLDLH
jgi:pyruvate dehydrogenase E2 component (dihydrolipoamide acetyltransferase)